MFFCASFPWYTGNYISSLSSWLFHELYRSKDHWYLLFRICLPPLYYTTIAHKVSCMVYSCVLNRKMILEVRTNEQLSIVGILEFCFVAFYNYLES